MPDTQEHLPAPPQQGWVTRILFPSIASGAVGGGIIGCGLGFLLAPPHHYAETVFGSAVVGTLVGFIIAWVGAAVVGMVAHMLGR